MIVRHPLYLLKKGRHARIFSADPDNMNVGVNKLEDIITTVLQPYRSQFSEYGVTNVAFEELHQEPIPYLSQYNEDDLYFLLRICETYGVHFTQNGDTILFRTCIAALPEAYEIPIHTQAMFDYSSKDASCIIETRDADYVNSYSNLPDDVPTSSYTIDKGLFENYIQLHYSNTEEVRQFLTTLGRQLEYDQHKIHIHNEKYLNNKPLVGARAGDVVTISGLDQQIFIHEVSWEFIGTETVGSEGVVQTRAEEYRIDLFGREATVPYVPICNHKKIKSTGFQKAIVISPAAKANADPNDLGRIKIRFLWDKVPDKRLIHMPEFSCWVRLVMPFAGKNHGFYVMPEVGDEVIIAFENGDIDRPVCLGSVYNIDSSFLTGALTQMQPNTGVAQMETATLKTPNNLVLEFWEAESEENKQRIVLCANQKITLEMNVNGGQVDYNLNSKGNISVNASGNLTENSDSQVMIKKGDQGKIIIGGAGEIDAKSVSTVNIDSSEKITLTCGEGSLSIDKSGNVNIKGTSISIGETGHANSIDVKGTAINIGDAAQSKSINVKGQTIKINDANNIEVNGTTITIGNDKTTSLALNSGGKIDVIASSTAKIEGKPIKLN
ncbi:type IV secretion protein Rhs [Candidatus Magnetomorum sp. HK-1]|nr:type IV secretion protein Rhs [Candidatus Magnetomorum sp. HK-1]